ncbi:deoxyribodipyrimidine photo-lyase family protein (cryptochrome) [Shimia isoporae]|uniref:Deoxyribodipyrimidine photo-lyase family protein (Cryptochrome) n=1 Tax=Shimia isoporae TaxID=647720 RepID=A0A4R1N7Y2_9RHOB|nr:FAD-binding domain-containing protein [Shimia isoporae]TCK99398.1 deoxyribodipyrimidine photo-lyase family protein (cryptochrome) [Shimia isoporae]
MQVVWFKRDLRVEDHRPLCLAAEQGAVLPLYVVEDALWQEQDMSARQWRFVSECLASLRSALAQLGQPLVVRRGDVVEVLAGLKRDGLLSVLWSHEETGSGWTFERDKRVAAWCRTHGVPWNELQNHGVVRGLASRDGWATRWEKHMSLPQSKPPALMPLSLETGHIPDGNDLRLAPDHCPLAQRGGRRVGLGTLHSFLQSRGETYRRAMSSPVNGAFACSRLSPYLAWGALSVREVHQANCARRASVAHTDRQWRESLKSFNGRLHWHCHFIQKLEDAPGIEFQNMHHAYDGVRRSEPDVALLKAWSNGETGLPFVDACMRSLRATGWLNFRMRAMVMATASYHLWLDWRSPGLQLARYFTDYEPGIHWSQVQMQSGTTGINTARIYNPVKQGKDQDPTGAFVRRWVPELREIDVRWIQEPWFADNADAVLDKVYPMPVVDHMQAAREARQKIWAVRRGEAFKTEAKEIQSRLGSRKRRRPRRTKSRNDAQLKLPFGDI